MSVSARPHPAFPCSKAPHFLEALTSWLFLFLLYTLEWDTDVRGAGLQKGHPSWGELAAFPPEGRPLVKRRFQVHLACSSPLLARATGGSFWVFTMRTTWATLRFGLGHAGPTSQDCDLQQFLPPLLFHLISQWLTKTTLAVTWLLWHQKLLSR